MLFWHLPLMSKKNIVTLLVTDPDALTISALFLKCKSLRMRVVCYKARPWRYIINSHVNNGRLSYQLSKCISPLISIKIVWYYLVSILSRFLMSQVNCYFFIVSDFLYQEAFLTTYRTFLTPLELLEKLCRRHDRFSKSPNPTKQRSAREAFSLLVRVVSDLT